MSELAERNPASFRDPSGFVLEREGKIYRQIQPVFFETYKYFVDSGLKFCLESEGVLLPSVEFSEAGADASQGHLTLESKKLAQWSYPYEWCFSQLKEAALLTLDLAVKALHHNMVLKDASAYNIQYVGCKPLFIDILSFDKYVEGEPWIAYKQFCQHFLAPLALQAWVDPRLGQLSRIHLDGIPLDLAAKLMPAASRVRPGLAAHLFLHAKTFNKPAGKVEHKAIVSKIGLLALLDSLKSLILSLHWEAKQTQWAEYYAQTNYAEPSHVAKKNLIRDWISGLQGAKTGWDLGANDGTFSQILVDAGLATVAWDIDPAAVEKGFLKHKGEANVALPLLLDLTNPSPAIGWAHQERRSFLDRGPVDVAMALALIHHLRIGNNTPLEQISDLFASLARWIIVEFVPKNDSQVERLLASRPDIFDDYTEDGFESSFGRRFVILRRELIPGTVRSLYLLERR